MSATQILWKVGEEVLHGSGCTSTPEPEELEEVMVHPPAVRPTGNLHSIMAKLQSRGGNPSFHKYAGDLWSIRARRFSICGSCRKPISVGQEITLFEGVAGWAHLSHAVDQPSRDERIGE